MSKVLSKLWCVCVCVCVERHAIFLLCLRSWQSHADFVCVYVFKGMQLFCVQGLGKVLLFLCLSRGMQFLFCVQGYGKVMQFSCCVQSHGSHFFLFCLVCNSWHSQTIFILCPKSWENDMGNKAMQDFDLEVVQLSVG